jgi:hypothetical protein
MPDGSHLRFDPESTDLRWRSATEIEVPTIDLVPAKLRSLYEVHEWRNAAGVLSTACPGEWRDILHVLAEFRLLKSDLVQPGKRKTPMAGKLDAAFASRGWRPKNFETAISVDGVRIDTPTHEVDCFKGRVALEVEWNNKDPFYDRDLNNFRPLFDLRAIDVGVIVTRADDLRPVVKEAGKLGTASTTWLSKLIPRLEGGGGGGCPVLVFGMTRRLYEAHR